MDTWDGTWAQLNNYRLNTGATYPLFMNGGPDGGGENLEVLYGIYHNFVVIDMRDHTVVYHAQLLHGHASRYQRDEIRGGSERHSG